jgi:hypothetical protein
MEADDLTGAASPGRRVCVSRERERHLASSRRSQIDGCRISSPPRLHVITARIA